MARKTSEASQPTHSTDLEERHVWSGGLEGGSVLLLGWSADLVWQREGQVLLVELEDVWPLALLVSQNRGLNNLDGWRADPVSGSQVLVHLVDGTVHGDISVLLEHVVVAGSGKNSEPHTEVLDDGRVLLEDLVDSDDLSVRLLDSLDTLDEVPELGPRADLVDGPDLHAEEGRAWVALRGEMTSHNLILMILLGRTNEQTRKRKGSEGKEKKTTKPRQ